MLVLTDLNFQNALDEHTLVLVEFFHPSCEHCKEFTQKYAEAAAVLKDKGSQIKLGKIDSTQQREIGRRYGVLDRVHPVIKFFRSKQLPLEYTGEKSPEAIVNWVEKKSKTPLTPLATLEDVQEFILKNEISIIGMFRDQRSWAVNNLVAVAENLDGYGYEFGITSDNDTFTDYEFGLCFRSFNDVDFIL